MTFLLIWLGVGLLSIIGVIILDVYNGHEFEISDIKNTWIGPTLGFFTLAYLCYAIHQTYLECHENQKR